MLEQSVPKDCTPWKGPMLQQFIKNYSRWEGPTFGEVHGGLSPAGAREESEDKGAAESKCDVLTATPIPCLPSATGAGGR